MEALILAGGRAERLGEAAQGRPKALVRVGGRPIAVHQVRLLARARVDRVIVSCSAGKEQDFEEALAGLGPEIVAAGEPEPLGRGGGIRFAARSRLEEGDLVVLNGDELLALDVGALLARHRQSAAAATVVVARPTAPFGVVELGEGDTVTAFREGGVLSEWVSCGAYVLGDEALALLPERGDHETTTFPVLAERGRLQAHRHEGLWLTVNTPKDLRAANEYVRANPEWLDGGANAGV